MKPEVCFSLLFLIAAISSCKTAGNHGHIKYPNSLSSKDIDSLAEIAHRIAPEDKVERIESEEIGLAAGWADLVFAPFFEEGRIRKYKRLYVWREHNNSRPEWNEWKYDSNYIRIIVQICSPNKTFGEFNPNEKDLIADFEIVGDIEDDVLSEILDFSATVIGQGEEITVLSKKNEFYQLLTVSAKRTQPGKYYHIKQNDGEWILIARGGRLE